VGRKTAETHGMKIGDRITLVGDIVGDIFPVTLELTVRGFYDAPRCNGTRFSPSSPAALFELSPD